MTYTSLPGEQVGFTVCCPGNWLRVTLNWLCGTKNPQFLLVFAKPAFWKGTLVWVNASVVLDEKLQTRRKTLHLELFLTFFEPSSIWQKEFTITLTTAMTTRPFLLHVQCVFFSPSGLLGFDFMWSQSELSGNNMETSSHECWAELRVLPDITSHTQPPASSWSLQCLLVLYYQEASAVLRILLPRRGAWKFCEFII